MIEVEEDHRDRTAFFDRLATPAPLEAGDLGVKVATIVKSGQGISNGSLGEGLVPAFEDALSLDAPVFDLLALGHVSGDREGE